MNTKVIKHIGKIIYLGTLFLVIVITSCDDKKILVLETGSQKPMPEQWIDKNTGHKVTRLTNIPGDSRSFYFHNNPFLSRKDSSGYLMIFYNSQKNRLSDKWYKGGDFRQLYSLDLTNQKTEQLTFHNAPIWGEIVAPKRRNVFYQSRDSIFAVNVDSHESKLVYVFPDSIKRAGVTSINSDENLLVGVFSVPEKDSILKNNPRKSDFFQLIYEAKLPHNLFTIDINSGELKVIHSDTAWINHVQFSPTDPTRIMFCHEGPWHKVDRIWIITTIDTVPELVHKRSVYREIAGHEFFSVDGKTIWFDLQIPRGETFYLAGYHLDSKNETRYAMTRDEWSIHFNISPDQKLFAGDGGDSTQVARARNGQWLYLFTPEGDSLKAEKLVNMKYHDYDLEPNVHFTPDGKQIIFRANFEGTTNIYAVDK